MNNIYQPHINKLIAFKLLALLVIIAVFFTSCQKEFLEKKPDRSRLVPKSLTDYQAMLDYSTLFSSGPGLHEVSADDFTISDAGTLALSELQTTVYKWTPNVFAGLTSVGDWNIPYQQIFAANVVLEGLEDLTVTTNEFAQYNNLKGTALFYRAFAYYNLAQLFAAPYDIHTANAKPGIPLRLVSDINARYARGTVQQTYDQILKDLAAALPLVPDQVSYKTRPCKAAVLAMLARVSLTMGDYNQAFSYADQTLKVRGELLDYTIIKGNATDRIIPSGLPNGNAEVIYYKGMISYPFPGSSALASVINPLYESYHNDDLRKVLFFRIRGNGVFTFRGTYGGTINTSLFTGLATDEMYLIRAECEARKGDVNEANNDLNHLLVKRFNKDKYLPFTVTDQEVVLKNVLLERRKELIGRGLRWTDLRRLNLDGRFSVDLSRTVSGVIYKLPANDNRYTFSIPNTELIAGLVEQNP